MINNVKIGVLSLGCPRNLVDSEVIVGILKQKGFDVIDDITKSDIAIVNTCSFIEDAKKESIDAILELAKLKSRGEIKKIIVCGCLPQRYKETLARELKEADAFIGVSNFEKLPEVIDEIIKEKRPVLIDRPTYLYNHTSPRQILTPSHYVYVKISEGCLNNCSYCIIPQIRGPFRSRKIESILEEIKDLSGRIKLSEINLISQDTTSYGIDLYGRPKLVELLEKILQLKAAKWLRLLYNHVEHFPKGLLELIKENNEICNYLDLPIQHINDRILKLMSRGFDKKSVSSLIEKIRKNIPDCAIRTSIIVGFPTETEKEFKELLEFIKQVKFERLGAFIYSQEEGTQAAGFKPQASQKIKQERLDAIMQTQQETAKGINKRFLGKSLEVLIDEKDASGDNLYIGRSQFDAPEVDGNVFVRAKKGLKPGDFVSAKIIDTLEYDLVGEI